MECISDKELELLLETFTSEIQGQSSPTWELCPTAATLTEPTTLRNNSNLEIRSPDLLTPNIYYGFWSVKLVFK